MARVGNKGFNTLLTGDKKIPADNADGNKGVSDLKFLSKTAYNDLIIAQKDFLILFRKQKCKLINMETQDKRDMQLSGNSDTTIGASKKYQKINLLGSNLMM